MTWVVAESGFSINNNSKNSVAVMEGWHGKEAVSSCCLILFFSFFQKFRGVFWQ